MAKNIAYRMSDWTHFGKWEKTIRTKRDIKLQDLAHNLGYKSCTTLSAYESNAVNPTLDKMIKIADALGYEIILRERK